MEIKWERIQANGASQGHVLLEVGELALDQLLGIQRAMPVLTRRNRRGDGDTSGVDGLKEDL